MEQITRQLEQVRRRGRLLLLAQRLFQWLAVVLPVVLALALLDYLLRLPGAVRLTLGLAVAGAALVWLATRLIRAWRFAPGLAELALRLEKLYPPLQGKLASAVEFHLHQAQFANQPRSAALARSSVEQTRQIMDSVKVGQLIDPSRTARIGVVFAVVLMGFGSVALIDQQAASTATARWLNPFGSAAWPKRTDINALVERDLWPIDNPLPLRATIDKGYHEGMRVRGSFRIIDHGKPAAWQDVLLTEQSPSQAADNHTPARADARKPDAPAVFERLIDLPPALRRTLTGPEPGEARIEFYFEAGDDQTDPQSIQLAARPAVTAVTARLTPPAYATGLVNAQTVALHEQTGPVASASALVGSSVELDLRFNKPLPLTPGSLDTLVAGFADVEGLRFDAAPNADRMLVRFPLRDSAQSTLELRDAHGLESLSPRTYRVEAEQDKAPAVSLTEPATDQAVLPTAVIDLAALAQDDVGVEQLLIEGQVPDRSASESEATASVQTFIRQTGRQPTLEATRTLDLTELALKPGDEVVLTAVAQDVFDLMGVRHDPVRSTPRTLKIIDETELAAQLRADLAGVRQQAVRLEQTQAQTQQQTQPQRAKSQQEQIGRRLTGQDEQIAQLEQRVQRNRLEDPGLSELMRRARELLNNAEQSSSAARQSLQEAVRLEDAARQMRQRSGNDPALQEKADKLAQRAQALAEQAAQAEQADASDAAAKREAAASAAREAQAAQREADASHRGEADQSQRQADAAKAEAQRLAQEAADAKQLARQLARMAEAAAESGAEDAQDQQRAAEQAAAQAQAAQQAAQQAQQQATQAQQAADAANPQAAQARQQAQQAQANARQQQQQVRQSLNELAEMLDQGATALALQQELNKIAEEQDELAQMTRKLLPRTAGLDREDLPDEVKAELDEIAQRQDELSQQAGEFARNARQTAQTMRNQGETDQERATAESLEEAADIAERQGLEQDMQQAAQNSEQNQLSQAGGAQADAQQTLSQMSQAMGSSKQKQQQMLRRRLAKLEQVLQNLIERQKAQLAALDDVADAAVDARLPELAPAQTAIRQATMVAETEARTDPSTEPVAAIIGKAIEAQGRAVVGLRGSQKPVARMGQQDAVDFLEQALAKVKEQQDEQEQEQQRQEREELRKAYQALADRQDALRQDVAALARKPALDRREQAKLRTQGNDQDDIRDEAAMLGENVQDTLVFKQTHTRIEAAAGRASDALLQARADQLVLLDQAQTAKLLRAMAEALKETQPDDKFETPPGGGGGGGGGEGGGEQPLVPDIAELKLLKGAQEAIYDETRVLADVLRDRSTPTMIDRVEGLGEAQAELHQMGKALIEKVTADAEGEE